jgi:similar to spore coat protein
LFPNKKIAPHETFEIHELLTFKNVCATKSATMGALVKDEELKALLHQDFSVSKEQIKELKSLLESSVFAESLNMNQVKH